MRPMMLVLLLVGCANNKDADDAAPTTESPDTVSSDTDTDTDTDTDSDADTDTDTDTDVDTDRHTDTPTFHYDSDHTGSTGARTQCDPGKVPFQTLEEVVLTDTLTGCMAGLQRTELVYPISHGALPEAQLRPGSGICFGDELRTTMSSATDATVPQELTLQLWDLTTGTLAATIPYTMIGANDQQASFEAPNTCDAAMGRTLLSSCDGLYNQPVGVSVNGGVASWLAGGTELTMGVDWGASVDEVWFWVIVPTQGYALGPWPASLAGSDWTVTMPWSELGLFLGDDHLQAGAIGCSTGTPVLSRVFP